MVSGGSIFYFSRYLLLMDLNKRTSTANRLWFMWSSVSRMIFQFRNGDLKYNILRESVKNIVFEVFDEIDNN